MFPMMNNALGAYLTQIPYSTNSKWQHGSLAEDLMIVPWITAAPTLGTRSLASYCPRSKQQQPATARASKYCPKTSEKHESRKSKQ